MNTKWLLGGSAIVLGTLGIAASFAPQELLAAVGIVPAGGVPVLMQLFGAALFAFALVNWTARGSLLGGIYNRPVAIGNMTHFVVGGLALTKAVIAGERHLAAVTLAVVYAVFAIGFAAVFFRGPRIERVS